MRLLNCPPPAFKICLRKDATPSAFGILQLRCDVEVPGDQEVFVTHRPDMPFLPERLAISWPAADRLDVLDLKIGNFSLFPNNGLDAYRPDETDQDAQLLLKMSTGESWPGSAFAARWNYAPEGADIEDRRAWPRPTHADITSIDGANIRQLGHTIPRRVCQVAQDIQLHVRVRSLEPPTTFEAILLGRTG